MAEGFLQFAFLQFFAGPAAETRAAAQADYLADAVIMFRTIVAIFQHFQLAAAAFLAFVKVHFASFLIFGLFIMSYDYQNILAKKSENVKYAGKN